MEIYLPIIVTCVILSGYFSATETAFSTFNRIRVKNMAEKGNKKAALALELSENYDSLISAILIGNNIVNILASAMSTLLFTNIIFKDHPGGADIGATVLEWFGEDTSKIYGNSFLKEILK